MHNALGDPRQFSYTATASGQSVAARLLAEGYSKRLIVALKQTENGLCVAGRRVRSSYLLKPGDILMVTLPQPAVARCVRNERVPVLYEDADIIVYDKPAGMVCHRSGSHYADTLENTAQGVFRAMSRLDRDTSGALVTAKHQLAAAQLWQKIGKRYLAVVQGRLGTAHGFIELPIARQQPYEPRQVVRADGKPARTEYRVLTANEQATAVVCTLHTGRMHQLRVHFSAVGHPILGDAFYGGGTADIQRQVLHCAQVRFWHPVTKKQMDLFSPLPADIADLVQKQGLDVRACQPPFYV
ncbi:MAG: RluA family pseudouridine synthase [Candidatus Fimivivens sp.]